MAQRLKKGAEANSHYDCEFREMLSRVGDKWSLLVIFILKDRPALRGRFSDLKRSIPGISQRMLTATVRNLERDGMLTRHVYAEVPPRVEYELTPLGRALMEPVLGLVSWLQSNWPVIRSARDRFDARKQATLARRAEALSLDEARVTRLGMRPPAEGRAQLASVRKQ
jgi:DNA-binding HxlR family transcriptional regulator